MAPYPDTCSKGDQNQKNYDGQNGKNDEKSEPEKKIFLFRFSQLRFTAAIWNPTFGNPDFFKIGFQMVQFLKSRAISFAVAMVLIIQKADHFK